VGAGAIRLVLAIALAAGVSAGVAATAQGGAKDEAQTGVPSRTKPSFAVGHTHNCAAFYPEMARRKNESGDVLVGYDVSADGSITHVAVVKSSGFPDLDLAAVTCVSTQWRNLPATKEGVAVASPGHRAIIRFQLEGPVLPALPDGSGAVILILSGLAIIGLGTMLAHFVTRARIAG
jgi:TonB family protein